jgi:hypothetical protein
MRWMLGWVMVAAVGLCASSAFGAEELKKVGTVGELRAVPMVRVDGGWNVRLGYGDSGTAGGPWVVVYCEAAFVGKEGARGPVPERPGFEALGPVMVKAVWDDEKRVAQQVKDAEVKVADGLYGVTVPLRRGTCVISVEDAQGHALVEKKLVFAEAPAATTWQTFAQPYRRGEAQGVRVAGASEAATLRIEGRQMLADLEARVREGGGDGVTRLGVAALPGMLPTNAKWFSAPERDAAFFPLMLTLNEGKFVIRTEGPKVDAWAPGHMLARWWVNKKPVAAERRADRGTQELRKVEEADTMVVDFGYPAALGAVKAGDEIGLQVIYAPHGYDTGDAGVMKMAQQRGFSVPMWSDVLEFALTKELMALREKNLQGD